MKTKLKTNHIFFSCLGFLIFFSSFSVIFPTWVREKGRFLIYQDVSYRATDEYFLAGEKIKANEFREISYSIYADYGVSEKYTVGFYMPALKSLSLGETPSTRAVTHINRGDMDFIQRWQIGSYSGAVFNVEFLIGIPTGVSEHKHALPTGDSEFNYQPGLSMGWGFHLLGLPSYLTLYTGMNFRNEGFSNEWHHGFQWGLFVYKKTLLLSFELKKLQSLKNNENTFTKNGLWNNTSYLSQGLGITYKFNEDIGLSFYYKTLLQSENSLGGNIYSVGGFFLF